MTDLVCAEVQIQPYASQQINDPSYLKVHTYPHPIHPADRIALVEWIKNDTDETTHMRLVNCQPMSHVDAMAVAILFAEKNGIPMIYERMDSVR